MWRAPRGWRLRVLGHPGRGTGAGAHRGGAGKGCWGDGAAAACPSSEWGVETFEAVSGLPERAVQFLHKFGLNSAEECYRFHRLSSLPYTGAAIHLCTAGTGLPRLLSPRVSPSLMVFVWTFLESPLAVRLPQVRSGWVSPEGTMLAMFPTSSTVQWSSDLEVVREGLCLTASACKWLSQIHTLAYKISTYTIGIQCCSLSPTVVINSFPTKTVVSVVPGL